MKQKDALTVLLTGRGETNFASTIKRIVASRGLQFDLVCLKPEVGPNNQRFATTMKFKQNFLEDLVLTYQQADEIRVYEDRVRQYVPPSSLPRISINMIGSVKGFREFFEKFNKELLASSLQPRQPIVAEVIQVAEGLTYLDPVTETAEVQHMMNAHNLSLQNPSISSSKSRYTKLRIKRTFFYTGYILSATDSSRLIDHLLAPQLPPGLAESGDIKFMANNVLITPRPPSKSILDKVGGFGKKMKWQITGTALWENKIWAARVAPVPETATYYSENPVPVIVLGLRKGARPIDASRIQNWQPVPPEKALVFDSTVGEKVLLRIEEDSNEGEWESLFLNKSHKRRQPYQNSREDDNYSRPRGNRESGGYQGANNYDHPPNARHQHHQQQQHQRHAGGDGGRHHNPHHDDGPRRGSGSNYRGRGRGGRGNRGGNQGRGGGRGRGRGGGGRDGGNLGGPPGYRSLDDYGSGGYDGTGEERGGGGNGGGAGPVMNY